MVSLGKVTLGVQIIGLIGCAHPQPARMAPQAAGLCRSGEVRWFAPEDARARARLDAWCAAVGPVATASGAPSVDAPVPASDVAFVSWNVHVGNGNLRAFVEDLRSGRLTSGRPPRHFVLLIQEAVRASAVPPFARGAEGARRINARHQAAEDIDVVSRSLGLWLIYAPSMRNGGGGDPAGDRGSAILSTLPLSNPTAVELPIGRQRRVALFADVALSPTSKMPVGVIHLDALNGAHGLWILGARGWRETQARSMETLLPDGALVLGADLNTWLGEGEAAARYFRRIVGGPAPVIEGSRARHRTLDYLFFRGAAAPHALVVSNRYGSDHHPLIGWFSN